MRKIAVIGSGFAGLSTAYQLKLNFPCEVTIFSKEGPLTGASSVASGLLHPFLGPFAKLAPLGKEAYSEAILQINSVEQFLDKPVTRRKGIFRPALFPRQERSFRKQARDHQEISWSLPKPPIESQEGIFISSGLAIFAKPYLQGLFDLCLSLDIVSIFKEVLSLEDLKDYDTIAWCCGAESLKIPFLSDLPLKLKKGQSLKVQWPKELETPHCEIIGRKYLLMNEDNISCIVGATYEESYENVTPNMKEAAEMILPALQSIHPKLSSATVLNSYSGLRAHGPQKKVPLLQKLTSKDWLFTGLGSRGLLYHAYCGKILAEAIYHNTPGILPFQEEELQ